jgi:MFS family permease
MFVDALGSGLYLPLTLLFVHQVSGLPLAEVGLGLTVAAALGLAANPLAGVLVDRIGPRRVLLASYLARTAGFAAYPLVGGMVTLVAVAGLVAAGDRAYYPAIGGYIAEVASGPTRDRLYALVRMARNVGFGAGGLLSAVAVSMSGGYRLVALVNAASFLAAAACLAATRPVTPVVPADPAGSPPGGGGYRTVLADRPFLRLTACELAFTLAHAVLPVALPVYAIRVLHAPPALLGVLFTLNTLLVGAGQVPVLRWQRRARRTHALALGGAVFIVGFGLYALAAATPPGAPTVAVLVTATLAHTLGELLHSTPSAALAAGAAPDRLRGRYLAVQQLTWGISATLAPAAFTAVLVHAPGALWLLLAGVLGTASLGMLRLAGALPATAVAPPVPG